MFTGLIETVGEVAQIRRLGRSVELRVRAGVNDYRVDIGASVAVDGVCLTVEKIGADGAMCFTAVAETLRRTTLDNIARGRRVNLERALKIGGHLDGHFVLGHVDAVGEIIRDETVGASVVRTIKVDDEFSPLIAEKGSVAVDGISLTVANVGDNTFSVSVIPETIRRTTMSAKNVGDTVNIECDVLARYIYRMMSVSDHTLTNMSKRMSTSEAQTIKTDTSKTETLVDKMKRLGF